MKLYNTYTNKLEEFKPLHEGIVTIYSCGPTVYNYIHIGNARPIVFFDTLKKYLEFKGLKVVMASNFTDLNEKILNQSKIEGISEMEVANKYIDAYLENVRKVGADDSYIKPRVTECIPEIIEFIQELIDNGSAYESDGDVYFRVSSVKNYGALSNRKTDELIQGARVEVSDLKESGLDFALWKKFDEGIVYDSPWGKGRPGWHTECCVMINNIFKGLIDIHGGGSDLVFPHHENEIAQNEALHHNRLANFWVHNARINFGDEKMSKSLGNVIWVKDLTCDPRAYRLLVLSYPYRNIISYTDELQTQFNKEFEKIRQSYTKLFYFLDINEAFNKDSKTELSESILAKFIEANENDMNTPNGITAIYEALKNVNQILRSTKDPQVLSSLYNILTDMLHIYGLDIKLERMDDETRNEYKEWANARTNKDFEKADHYRNVLIEKGIEL